MLLLLLLCFPYLAVVAFQVLDFFPSRTLSVYEATNSLGEGDALGPRLRLNELAEFFPDCEDGGAEGIGKTTEAGGGHLARASDRGRMVLLSNLVRREKSLPSRKTFNGFFLDSLTDRGGE